MLKLFNKTMFVRQFSTILDNNKFKLKTAGIIVIGDEILKGDVVDTNSTYITRELYNLGVRVKKISVVGDELAGICDEVKLFSNLYTYVITTGGIGPTHDDITFEAVAKAFNKPLVLNGELMELCRKYYKTSDPTYPGMKLAYIPESSELNYGTQFGGKLNYPNISLSNVYMFPGIPELLVKLFHNVRHLFKSENKFFVKIIYFNVTEDVIVTALNQLVQEYPQVQFGSYPKLFHDSYKVKVTIESINEELAIGAYKKLIELVPNEFIVP